MSTATTKSYNASLVFKNLANSRNGDVTFLVGGEKKIVYAFKVVLASVSPVFKNMFFGDLKERSHVTVPDMSYDGFSNMIKLIHGYEINQLSPGALVETLIAVDKYLIDSLKNDLCSYFEENLDGCNAVNIFDEMVQSNKMGLPIEVLKKCIQSNCKTIFNNELHVQLSESAVMAILNMKWLDILEIDVLKAISNWIVAKLGRDGLVYSRDNKQQAFKPFKSLVRFSDLTANEFVEHKHLIDDLLTENEAYNLLGHLVNDTFPLNIKYEGDRTIRLYWVYCGDTMTATHSAYVTLPLIAHLKVNQKVFVQSIRTILSAKVKNLKCKVFMFDGEERQEMTKLIIKETVVADKWEIEFVNVLEMSPNIWYSVQFEFTTPFLSSYNNMFRLDLNEENEGHYLFKQNKKNPRHIRFRLVTTENINYHCIDRVNFRYLN